MAEVQRTVTKVLAAEEDFLFGEGQVQQVRGQGNYLVTKVRGFRPVNSQAELDALDPELFPKAVLVENGEYTHYQYNGTSYEVVRDSQTTSEIKKVTPTLTDLVFNTVAEMQSGKTGIAYTSTPVQWLKVQGENGVVINYITATSGDVDLGGGVFAKKVTEQGDNTDYATVEQSTHYTMTPNRHVFGEEYLWGLHKHIIDTKNSQYIEFLWSGDSTTRGDNAGAWKLDALGEVYSAHFGLAVYDHINKGHSGDSAVEWNSTWVDADITSNPNMRVYITRWGINDGALHGDVSTYINAMDSGLSKLRASKSVEDLTIIVMSPNSTYDDPNNRGTDWYEQIIPELRKICRKHMAVFIDTYSIWQDAKQGALAGDPRWLDDPYGDGRGIHPDAAFNHQIVYKVMSTILEPVLSRPNIKSNTFTNTSEVQFVPLPTTVPNNWTTGISLWTSKVADGWLVDGKLRVFRNGNKVIQELFYTGVDDSQNDPTTTAKFVRWGDATLNTWTKWYNAAAAPALINGWVATSGRIPKYVHHDNGICSLMGTLQGGADTTVAFNVPTEMRPGFPRTFIVAGDVGAANIIVNTNGDVQIYLNGGTYANLDGLTWVAGN